MEAFLPYLPYLITAAISWAASSRLNIWIPVLDPSAKTEPPVTGRKLLDLVVSIAWRLLPDEKTRDLVKAEVELIAKALDAYNVKPLIQEAPK